MDERAHAGLSIVVLTHNRRELLRGCLESLFQQSDPGVPLEIVVVDDGSTDGTRAMVDELRAPRPWVEYRFQEHRGIPAARNAGIRSAIGDVIAIVADDYVLAPDYAKTIISFFREEPSARVVRFKIVAAGDDFLSRVSHAYREASIRRRLFEGATHDGYHHLWREFNAEERYTVNHGLEAAGAAAFAREVFDEVGLFDESFLRAEDTDFTRRLRMKGIQVHYVPIPLIRHRYSSNLPASIRTCFESGRFRWHYYAKYSEDPVNLRELVSQGVKVKSLALCWTCRSSGRPGSLGRFFLYLPFMFLFEASNKAGFFCEWISSRRKKLLSSGSAG